MLRSGFAGYVLLASQNPHPIIVYSVANYRQARQKQFRVGLAKISTLGGSGSFSKMHIWRILREN